jgi:hypothetical protein
MPGNISRLDSGPAAEEQLQLNERGADSFQADGCKLYYVGTLPGRVRAQATAFAITPLRGVPVFAANGLQLLSAGSSPLVQLQFFSCSSSVAVLRQCYDLPAHSSYPCCPTCMIKPGKELQV